LKKGDTIQKCVAFFLLLLFSISIAPKAYFHTALANHKDAITCHHAGFDHCLHQQGFHCHFDDLVVSSPFLHQQSISLQTIQRLFTKEDILFATAIAQRPIQHKEGRGPPNS
jgi:hypothetical protein